MKSNGLIAVLLAGILGGGDGLAWAQTIILTPSLTVSEEFDDNVFLTPTNRQSDFITSVTPGLRLAITEHPWDVTMDLSARGEYYVDRPELNSSTDYQTGSLTIEYRPTPRFTASVSDTFIRSLNTADVAVETGIITGRFSSYSNTVAPAVQYQLDPLTQIRLGFSFNIFRSEDPNAEDSDSQEADVFMQRMFTPRTSGTLRYAFTRFQVEGAPGRDAHFPRVGLIHALSPSIRVSADAGPLLIERADGSTEVNVGGSLAYAQQFTPGTEERRRAGRELRRAGFSVAYDRSARLAGAIGEVVTVQGLTAIVTFLPTRALSVELEARATLTESADTAEEFRGYTAGIRLDYLVLEWLSVTAGYRHSRQDDRTGPLDLQRNLVFLGLTASTDMRIY